MKDILILIVLLFLTYWSFVSILAWGFLPHRPKVKFIKFEDLHKHFNDLDELEVTTPSTK